MRDFLVRLLSHHGHHGAFWWLVCRCGWARHTIPGRGSVDFKLVWRGGCKLQVKGAGEQVVDLAGARFGVDVLRPGLGGGLGRNGMSCHKHRRAPKCLNSLKGVKVQHATEAWTKKSRSPINLANRPARSSVADKTPHHPPWPKAGSLRPAGHQGPGRCSQGERPGCWKLKMARHTR